MAGGSFRRAESQNALLVLEKVGIRENIAFTLLCTLKRRTSDSHLFVWAPSWLPSFSDGAAIVAPHIHPDKVFGERWITCSRVWVLQFCFIPALLCLNSHLSL